MADKHYHTTPRPHTEGPANTWCRPSAATTGLCSSRSRPSSCCRRGEHACRARSHFVVGRNRNTSCNRAASTQPTPNPTLSPHRIYGTTSGTGGSGSASSSAAASTSSFGRRVVDATAQRMPTAAATGRAWHGPDEVVDVAIVGGGIGGLATALAFKRLTNLTCHVFERWVGFVSWVGWLFGRPTLCVRTRGMGLIHTSTNGPTDRRPCAAGRERR